MKANSRNGGIELIVWIFFIIDLISKLSAQGASWLFMSHLMGGRCNKNTIRAGGSLSSPLKSLGAHFDLAK